MRTTGRTDPTLFYFLGFVLLFGFCPTFWVLSYLILLFGVLSYFLGFVLLNPTFWGFVLIFSTFRHFIFFYKFPSFSNFSYFWDLIFILLLIFSTSPMYTFILLFGIFFYFPSV